MDELAIYFPPWISWIVLSAMSIAASAAYWRLRKASLLVLLAGVVVVVIGEMLKAVFEDPFHPLYVWSAVVGLAGVATIAAGLAWYLWKDRRWGRSRQKLL